MITGLRDALNAAGNFFWNVLPDIFITLENPAFSVIIIFFLIIALTLLVAAIYYYKQYRSIADTPTSKIRSAAQGYVEFEGIQQQLDYAPFTSPLSKQHCTWYFYQVERRVRTQPVSKNNQEWHIIDKGISKNLFELKDATGSCIIDPRGAKILGGKKRIWFGMRRHPLKFHTSFYPGRKRYRYTEIVLFPGTYLYALGMFHSLNPAQRESDKHLHKILGNRPETLNILSARDIDKRPFILSATKQSKLITIGRVKSGICSLLFLCIMAYAFHILILKGLL